MMDQSLKLLAPLAGLFMLGALSGALLVCYLFIRFVEGTESADDRFLSRQDQI